MDKKRVVRAAQNWLAAVAVAVILLFLAAAAMRIPYPYELEWVEGTMLDQTNRVLEGKQIFVKPSLEFTPFFYPPLFFYFSAAVSLLTGPGFLPLRLVSLFATLGCFLLILLFVKKETKSIHAGIIAAGLFAATYRISGDWFDVGRVDMLFVFFLLLSAYVLRFGKSSRALISAGIFAVLSFLSKQAALLVFPALIIAGIILHKRKSVIFITTIAALTTASMLSLNITSDGWFWYYLKLAGQHQFLQGSDHIFNAITKPLFSVFYIAWLAAAIYLFNECIVRRTKKGLFYLLFLIGALSSSIFSILHSGGYWNVFIPTYAVVSILSGTSFTKISTNSKHAAKMAIAACALMLAQLFLLASFSTAQMLPDENDYAVGEKTLELIKSFPGDVFVPTHSYLAAFVGKKTYANIQPIWDIARAKNNKESDLIKMEILRALQTQQFSAIILSTHPDLENQWGPELNRTYFKKDALFVDETGYISISGLRVRPSAVYVPLQKN
jgi:4-amino-4-deoxy-L-arabinose transferase-like glycosyltransferase